MYFRYDVPNYFVKWVENDFQTYYVFNAGIF